MRITDALVVEHAAFCAVFDQIERVLPQLETRREITHQADLVEGLLRDHGAAEANLVYVALDHALEHRGQLDRLFEDHHELDDRLKRAQTASDPAEARRLLQEVVTASREHFAWEESGVFPLIEGVLRDETLQELGGAWLRRRRAPASSAVVAQPTRDTTG